VHRLTNVLQANIAHESARQKARLAQDLEAVTDAENQSSTVGELLHRFHDGRKLGDRARAQVVPVGKPARHNDRVAIFEVMRFVPQECDWLFRYLLDSPVSVVITVRSGKDDDAEFHCCSLGLSGVDLILAFQKWAAG